MRLKPERRDRGARARAVLSGRIIEMGYLAVISVAERASDPHLRGLSSDVQQDPDALAALHEIGEEYGADLGLDDADPITRLAVVTLALAANRWAGNKVGGVGGEGGAKVVEPDGFNDI